jgi:glycerophosphoryl diester phosphodiesterase
MSHFPYLSSRPLNLGHRGSPRSAPENTLASFQKAREEGADGVELDVQLSSDGQVVVIHDDAVDRTTNSQGAVKALSLEQLRQLDAGSWLDPRFVGERIPTLEEVCAWAAQDMLLNIELKNMDIRGQGIEPRVAAIVRQFGLRERVIFSSFNPFSLRRIRACAPEFPTGLLYSGDLPLILRRAWLRPWLHPDALHPHLGLVNEPYLKWAKGRGLRVNVWTVDTAQDMQQLVAQKVDAIITNQPGALARLQKR